MPLPAYRVLVLLLLGAFGVGGLLQSVSIYPFQVPDERTHWLAGVSRVNALLPGRDARCDSLMGMAEQFQFGRIVFNQHEKGAPGAFAASQNPTPACVDPKMNYGFILSYPGVVAALLCRQVLPLSDVTVLYLARFFEGLMVLAFLLPLFHLAVADGGNLLWKRFALVVLGFVLLTPIGLQQSFGVSVDPLMSAFALFIVGLLWKPKLKTADLVCYAVLGAAAAITKPPLLAWLFPLGIWLRVNGRFEKGKRVLVFRSPQEARFWLATAVVVLVTLGMSLRSVAIAVPLGRANPVEQMAFLKAHPLEGLAILWRGIEYFLHRPGLLSNVLGWLDYNPTPATLGLQRVAQTAAVMVFFLPLFAAGRSVKARFVRPKALSLTADALFLFGLFASMLGVAFFLYLYWTVPAAAVLDGLQMRYFLCHLLVFIGWLGWRADATFPVVFKAPSYAPSVMAAANGVVALALLAYLVERCFSNLVRYY